jgi:glyoxylase-like metal-dependent hydrolase (beta-lactamase superfamily II)/8-oxo-dGTP pyrophosphatase MutT (NUDIX family)|tara:strand:+ start:1740 stop:3164 length:1425 start_codon:yes stop_codon:yes gene_type:complete
MLMGLRHPDVPTFPEFWAFPGGGVSKEDVEYARKRSGHGDDDQSLESLVTLFREVVEETGLSKSKDGGWVIVPSHVRKKLIEGPGAWTEALAEGMIHVDTSGASLVTERTTPPLAPVRYTNRFYHIHLGEYAPEPEHPPGRSEFTEFKWWDPEDILEQWRQGTARMAPPQVTFMRDIVDRCREGRGILEILSDLAGKPPMGAHKIEFAPGVECLPIPTATLPPATHTNCFIIGQGDELLLVDPAIQDGEGQAIIVERLNELESNSKRIKSILYTHRHTDHIGDRARIKEIVDVEVLGTSETLAAIGGGTVIREGDIIDLGDNLPWTVIETPGHCPGMVSLISKSGLLSADNVTMVGTILVPSADGDMHQYMNGLERLHALNPNLLFPSHGPVCAAPMRVLSRTLKHRKERHSKVLNAVNMGLNRLADIAMSAYKNVPDAPESLVLDQTLSHLRGLVKEGLVVEEGDVFTAIQSS